MAATITAAKQDVWPLEKTVAWMKAYHERVRDIVIANLDTIKSALDDGARAFEQGMREPAKENIPAKLIWGGVKICVEEIGGVYGKATCLVFETIAGAVVESHRRKSNSMIEGEGLRSAIIELKCKLEGLKDRARNECSYQNMLIDGNPERFRNWGKAERKKFMDAQPKPDKEFKQHYYRRHVQRLEWTIARAFIRSCVVVERHLEQVHDFKTFTSSYQHFDRHNLSAHQMKYLKKFGITDCNDLLRWGATHKI